MSRVQSEPVKAIGILKMQARLAEFGLEPVGSRPEQSAQFLKDDIALQSRIQRKAHIDKQ